MTLKLRSVVVEISFWFIAVLTLMLVLTGQSNGVWCFLMCVLHECGHLGMMFAFKKRPKRIELGYFGMKIVTGHRLVSPFADIIIAVAGPMVNFLLAGLFGFLGFDNISKINLVLAIFNLLPVTVLDGGRILACLTENTRLLKNIGLCTAVVLCFVGAAVALFSRKNCIILIVSLYLLIGVISEK